MVSLIRRAAAASLPCAALKDTAFLQRYFEKRRAFMRDVAMIFDEIFCRYFARYERVLRDAMTRHDAVYSAFYARARDVLKTACS